MDPFPGHADPGVLRVYIATFGLMTYLIYSFFQSSALFIEQIRSYVHIFLFLCIQKLVYSPCTCYNTNNASDSKPSVSIFTCSTGH